MNAAKTTKKKNPKTGRIAQHYLCATCAEEFTSTNVQCDHIEPVVDPVEGFKDWDTYIDRLYCGADNMQCLCSGCHALKTAEEKQLSTLTKQSKPQKAKSSLRAPSRRKS